MAIERIIARRGVLAGLAACAAAPAWARLAQVPPPGRELMVPVTGGRIYVRVTGDLAGAKPPLIAIPGGPGGSHAGMAEMLALADERAVVLYDPLDTGKSDKPGNPTNWTVARFASELSAIRSVLGIARWHVLGQSWGGTVALEYAARNRAVLASTILASPLVSTRSWIADARALRGELPADVQATLTSCEARTPPAAAICDAATERFYAEFVRREPEGEAVRAYGRVLAGPGNEPFNGRMYETMWGKTEFVATGTLKTYDGEPLLARLDGKRTLFVCGQYDEARPLTMQTFARRVPGSEFAVIPGAAHAIDTDRPDETVAILRGWMARRDAA